MVGGRIPHRRGVSITAYTSLALCAVLLAIRSAWRIGLSDFVSLALGVTLLFVGVLIYVLARFRFGAFRRTWGLRLDTLVTDGVYRVSRHPQAVGMFFILSGIAFLGRSGAALFLSGVYAAATVLWLTTEEKVLESRFGDEYRHYRSRTPRYLGLPRPGHRSAILQ